MELLKLVNAIIDLIEKDLVNGLILLVILIIILFIISILSYKNNRLLQRLVNKIPLQAKREFGFVPDSQDMFLRLKGLEYLNFMGDIYRVPGPERKERISALAERFGLREVLLDQIQSYSHGMRQKIILMGALLHEPAVWILDEPLTGLDPRSAYILKEMMREHADKGNTVFFSTHVLEVAEKICDRVAIINKGKLIIQGTLDQIREHFKENESLEQMFLELTEDG
jgi:ABC-2 type transport system ATP-binding protein